MSDRACYIQRTDRGARIERVRLLGERADESWTGGGAYDAETAAQNAEDAAEWIRTRLAETRTPKRLDTLCLDADGAVCSWVKGRDADAELIRSAVEGAAADTTPEEHDAFEPVQAPGVADRLPRLPREVSYGVLEHGEPEQRAAVLAAPDAPARLILDRLDALGVRVDRVITVWHALAEAWDPGARAAGSESPDVVQAEHPPAAVVAIDHDAARLLWCWSRRGVLLAAGSMRLRRVRGGQTPRAEVHEHDIARLAADWLGWSAQTGVCPARVVVVGRPGDSGMSAGEIGAALTRAWPGALADLVGSDDAVGETLRRTFDARHLGFFAPLTERPTRAHRRAYRWTALALLAAAVGLGVLAGLLFQRAAGTRAMAEQIRVERNETLTAIDPALIMSPLPLSDLETQIAALERRTGAVREENPRPILAEMEAITFVLGAPGVTLDELDVQDSLVTVKVKVDSVQAAEALDQALRSVGGSQVRWTDASIRPGRGGQIEATYSARWPQERTTP